MNDLWYQRWGGRKFLMCAAFGAVFCLMFQFGKLSETAFQFLMGGTVLVFVAGNVGQKALVKTEAKP